MPDIPKWIQTVADVRAFAQEGSLMVVQALGSRYDAKDISVLGEAIENVEQGMRVINAALRAKDLRVKQG